MTRNVALPLCLLVVVFAGRLEAAPVILDEGYRAGAVAMAVAPDGGTFVVLQRIDKAMQPGDEPKLATILEFLRFRPDGSLATTATLPVSGRRAEAMPRIAVLPSGEVALFAPSGDLDDRRATAQLLLLSPDGQVRHQSDVGPPGRGLTGCGGGTLYANVLQPGPKATLLIGGGYCDGPSIPWWTHLSADGRKLAEGTDANITPGPGITAAAFEADGRFRLAGSHFSAPGRFDATLGFYGADGRIEARHTLLPGGGEVGWTLFTAHGVVFVGDSRSQDSALRFYDRDGKLLRSTPWREMGLPTNLIADADGIAGILGAFKQPQKILRIDTNGKVVWQSPPAEYLSIVRAPDGSLRALSSLVDENGRYLVELLDFHKP